MRIPSLIISGLFLATLPYSPPVLAQAPPTAASAPMETAGEPTQLDHSLRTARSEVAIGGAFLGLGAAGFGMFGVGSFLHNAADRERARLGSLEGVDTSALEAQEARARGLMIAGGLIGTAGVILGGTLLGVGLREYVQLRRAIAAGAGRRSSRRARRRHHPVHVRVRPSFIPLGAGLTLRI